MKSIRLLALSVLAAACFVPATAFAAGGSTLMIGATGGFGGHFNGNWDSTLGNSDLQINLGGDIDEVKMESTWGGMVHYDSVLHPYFALGGRVSVLRFTDQDRADDDWSRNTSVDIDIVPRLRFEIPQTPVELYVAVPLGVSVLKASEDWRKEANLDFDWGAGFNISALLGAALTINDGFGVFVEAGWSMHTVNFDGEIASGLGSGSDVSLHGDFSQFGATIGILLSL